MSVRNQKKYMVCFKHNEICETKLIDNSNNVRTNKFLQEHLGCPITLLSKDELSEYSTKRFLELLHVFEKN